MNDKEIWKYSIEITDIQTVMMPKDSDILSCQAQYGDPKIWAIGDPSLEKEDRFIEIIGTGNPAHETANVKRVFIDTFQMHGGDLVFHAFERVEREIPGKAMKLKCE